MSATEYAAKELYLLNRPGLRGVQFHGPTMRPFLRDRDRLVIRPVDWDHIRIGDIITYRLEDKFPTCRVARRTEVELLLKADNWPQFSATVGPDDVVGKVVQRERDGRIVSCRHWRWRLYTARWMLTQRYRGWRASRNSARAT
jgi:hypothetical protein